MFIFITVWSITILLTLIASIAVWIRNWNEERGQNSLLELLYISPSVILTVCPHIGHILFHSAPRVVSASLEFLFYIGCWVAVFKLNMEGQSPKWCWARNTIALVCIWGIIVFLRTYVY